MRVAILHHWFVSRAGGERVVDAIASIFPTADVFTLFLDKQKLPPALRQHRITTSFLDKIPAARRVHRHFLALYPLAVERLELDNYDLIISSDSGPIKGIITDPESPHICYCHSPMRYLWDAHSDYLRDMQFLNKLVFGVVSHYVRNWDYAAAQRVDHFVANSRHVAGRIRKYYRRDSIVIHPPIDTAGAFLAKQHDDYYLAVGRLVPYKRTDIIIEACRSLRRKLLVVGEGPEMKRLKRVAGKTVEFLGEVDDGALRELYARCRALLFAAEEDFGMVALEAQAYGRPVIAYGKGGSLETVVGSCYPVRHQNSTLEHAKTGVFFLEQTPESLVRAMIAFESCEDTFLPETIQAHARAFDTSVFVQRMRNYISEVVAEKWPSLEPVERFNRG